MKFHKFSKVDTYYYTFAFSFISQADPSGIDEKE